MRLINTIQFAVVIVFSSVQFPATAQEEPQPIIVPAPELEILVSPTSGGVPVDVVIDVVNAYHPFGVYKVGCGLLRDNSDGINVHPRYFDIDEEGSFRIPWHYEIYVTEPGKYTLYASLSFDYDNAPEGDAGWEYAAGAVMEVEVDLNFGFSEIALPEPRPVQNAGYQAEYKLVSKDHWVSNTQPVSATTITPSPGKNKAVLFDVSLADSYSPAGNQLKEYTAFLVPVTPEMNDDLHGINVKVEMSSATVNKQEFADPLHGYKVSRGNSCVLKSYDPLFRFEVIEPGCYVLGVGVADSNGYVSRINYEHINVLGAGQQAPVANLACTPAVIEREEITLLQLIIDEGGDPASVLGREDETVRVRPRGAVALKLDASGSHGSITKYIWNIYADYVPDPSMPKIQDDDGYFANDYHYTAITTKPELVFFVDSTTWPAGAVRVELLVVNSSGFVDNTSLVVGVEQDLPFGVTSEIQTQEPGTDTDRYMGIDENGDVYWWYRDENGNVVIED